MYCVCESVQKCAKVVDGMHVNVEVCMPRIQLVACKSVRGC
jgi:hypothetical protein